MCSNFLNQILYSLKLGDGCYTTQCSDKSEYKNYYLSTSASVNNLDYLIFKREALISEGIYCRPIKELMSGFNNNSSIRGFSTRNHEFISRVGNMSRLEVIKSLDHIGLSLYYLDDGSLHKTRYFGHIYCSSFNTEEVQCLINKIYELYPIKLPKVRVDRKKDGREFPYVYLPVALTKQFCINTKDLLIDKFGLKSMIRKTDIPSQTN